jgi:nucleotide-binding universal stress UspA family protein
MTTVHRDSCTVFDDIVCAVDGSQPSLEAARQAGVLRSESGQVTLVAVVPDVEIEYSPYGGPLSVPEAEQDLAVALRSALPLCPGGSSELLYGPVIPRLVDRLRDADASLVAVGAGIRSRALGAVGGSVTSAMLHGAPSSVLVARAPAVVEAFPHAIVVGYDGSPGASAALAVARHVAERFGARLEIVVAGLSAGIESDALAGLTVHRDRRKPVEVLVESGADADLLVVGSRGLAGLHAIGSVSERVGHQATSSVLVVRP